MWAQRTVVLVLVLVLVLVVVLEHSGLGMAPPAWAREWRGTHTDEHRLASSGTPKLGLPWKLGTRRVEAELFKSAFPHRNSRTSATLDYGHERDDERAA